MLFAAPKPTFRSSAISRTAGQSRRTDSGAAVGRTRCPRQQFGRAPRAAPREATRGTRPGPSRVLWLTMMTSRLVGWRRHRAAASSAWRTVARRARPREQRSCGDGRRPACARVRDASSEQRIERGGNRRVSRAERDARRHRRPRARPACRASTAAPRAPALPSASSRSLRSRTETQTRAPTRTSRSSSSSSTYSRQSTASPMPRAPATARGSIRGSCGWRRPGSAGRSERSRRRARTPR